jgi:hypothetical protein
MLTLFALFALAKAPQEPTDKMWVGNAAGYSVRVISANLNDSRVHVNVIAAHGLPHGVEAFHQFISRVKPVAAVNGAYASKTDFQPIGDIVIKGRVVYSGMMGTALAITKDNQVTIRRVRWGHAEDWSQYETVLACGPALVLNGQVDVLPQFEHFSDPHVMGSTRRVGVGVTPGNHLLLVNTLSSVTFYQFGKIMRALGCRDAMNLDAGASMGVYYRGAYHATPGRHITNVLAINVGANPDLALLYSQGGAKEGNRSSLNEGRATPPLAPPQDPGNSNAANATTVELCADSMGRANAYCPQKIRRRLARNKMPRPCPFHRAPAGER